MRLLALLTAGLFAGAVMAEDKKDEKIDPAKLVGKWKANKYAGEVPKEPMTFEFDKEGGYVMLYTVGKDLAKIEGSYKVNGARLVLVNKGCSVSGVPVDILKLTDTEFHMRSSGVDKKNVTELERVKDEKKDK